MANEQNLLKGEATRFKTGEEQAKTAAKGGRASGAAKRRKKDLATALQMLLDKKYTDKSGHKITGTEAISAKLFEQAMKGNIKAFETIRDSVGQKMPERIMIAEVEQSIIDEVERAVLGDE